MYIIFPHSCFFSHFFKQLYFLYKLTNFYFSPFTFTTCLKVHNALPFIIFFLITALSTFALRHLIFPLLFSLFSFTYYHSFKTTFCSYLSYFFLFRSTLPFFSTFIRTVLTLLIFSVSLSKLPDPLY